MFKKLCRDIYKTHIELLEWKGTLSGMKKCIGLTADIATMQNKTLREKRPHWLFCCPKLTPGMLLLQDVCICHCLCLQSLPIYIYNLSLQLRSLLKSPYQRDPSCSPYINPPYPSYPALFFSSAFDRCTCLLSNSPNTKLRWESQGIGILALFIVETLVSRILPSHSRCSKYLFKE